MSNWGSGWTGHEEHEAEAAVPGSDDWFAKLALERLLRRRAEAKRRAELFGVQQQQEDAAAGGGESSSSKRQRRAYGPYVSSADAASGNDRPPPFSNDTAPPSASGSASGGGSAGASADARPPLEQTAGMRRATATSLTGEEARAADAEAWKAFAAAPADGASAVGMSAVPWPSGGDVDPLGLKLRCEQLLSGGELKVAVRTLQRQWHPDKFAQRFAKRLAEGEREAILARVNVIAQCLNAVEL